jgi:cytochrome c-type biogenesis protein CcmE
MTRKRRRLYVVLLGMATLGVAAALVLTAFEDNIVFFHSPTDIATKDLPKDRRFRVGGLVVAGSIKRDADGVTIRFGLTDMTNTVAVAYRGVLPDLFREGQGAVVEGKLGAGDVFRAEEVLAKHDETYMPKEVADALKKSGQWKGTQ